MEFDTLEKPPLTLKISHQIGAFQVSNEEHHWHGLRKIDQAVIINVVKWRTMWPPYGTAKPGEGLRPLCVSHDNVTGYPGLNFPTRDERYDTATENFNGTIACDPCGFRKDQAQNKKLGLPVCQSVAKTVMLDPDYPDQVILFDANGAAKNEMSKYVQRFLALDKPMFMSFSNLALRRVRNNGAMWADLSVTEMGQTPQSTWIAEYLPLFETWTEKLSYPPELPGNRKRPEFEALDM